MTLVLLCLFLLTLLFLIWFRKQARRHKGPAAAHFDGRAFHNLNKTEPKSLWTVIHWVITGDHAPWPKKLIKSAGYVLPVPKKNQIIVTYINHASCLIQTGNINIITDPHYSHRASPVGWAGPHRVHEPGVPYDKLPPIHVVLISHDHYDHMDKRTLKRLYKDHKPTFIVGLGNDVHLKSFGITENVKTLDWWQSVKIEGLTYTFVPGQHFSGRGIFDHNTALWGGFVIQANKAKIFFNGDAGYSSHYKEINGRFGPMDVSLLPIGAYQPRWFMQAMHTNPKEAVMAHLDLQSKTSIGIHFQTFQLSEEPYDQPVIDLELAKEEYKIAADAFVAPDFGQSFIVSSKPGH